MSWRNCKERTPRACLPPLFVVEPLELRMLLTGVSATTLAGPFLTDGAVFNYLVSATGTTATDVITQTVIGPATAPTGQAATERDSVIVATSATGGTSTDEIYYGFDDSNDAVEFAQVETQGGQTDNVSYSPPQIVAPVMLTAGTPFNTTTTETDTVAGSTGTSTETVADSYTLVSATASPITVTAGTFQAYEVIDAETTTPALGGTPTTVTTDYYFSSQAGLVEVVENPGAAVGQVTTVLTSYSVPDRLVFTVEPAVSGLNTPIATTVTVENGNNAVDTSATGTIDLTLNTVEGGADAVLGGTVSANLVNGVATFTTSAGPTINVAGTYTLTATDNGASITATDATSTQFVVGNSDVWSGAGDGINWSDPKNWEQDEAPISGDSLLFPTGAPLSPNNDIAGLSLNSIEIAGSGYTLTGNAISLTGSLTSDVGNNTYNIDTTLVGSPTVTDATGDLTISSVFSGGGGLTVAGDGTLDFTQDCTYTGATTLSAGVTVDDDDLADEFGANTITVGAGSSAATIDNTGDETAIISNNIVFQDGSTLANDPEVDFTGNITINGQAAVAPITSSDEMFLNGSNISGTGTITIKGAGKVQITGNLIPSIQLAATSGELDLGANLQGALNGSPQVVVSGGTLQLLSSLEGTGGIDVQSGVLSSGGAGGYSGTITLEQTTGTVTVALTATADVTDYLGTGALVVASPALSLNPLTSYSAPEISNSQSDETLTLDNAVSFQKGSSLNVNGDVTFDGVLTLLGAVALDTTASTEDLVLNGGMQGIGTLTLDGPGSTFVNGDIAAEVGLIAGGPLAGVTGTVWLAADLQGALTGASQVTVNGAKLELLSIVEGTGGIDMQSGRLQSSGAGGYSGTITLEVAAPAVMVLLEEGTDDLGTGQLVVAGSSLNLLGNGSALDTFTSSSDEPENDVAVTLNNAVSFQNGSFLNVDFGNVTFGGLVTLQGSATLSTSVGSDTLSLGGGMQGTGTATLGSGRGGTTIVNGNIAAGVGLIVGNPPGPVIAGATGSTVQLGANLQGALTGASQVTLEDATLKLLSTLRGTGGIDVQALGALTSDGASGYSGTITLELADQPPTVLLTPNANELGKGLLVVTSPSSNPLLSPNSPIIFGPNGGQPVTLNNAISFQSGSSLSVTGNVTFAGLMTIQGAAAFKAATDSNLTLNGNMQGFGTLTLDGPGTTFVNGSIGSAVGLVAGGPLAGTTGAVSISADLEGPALTGASQLTVNGVAVTLSGDLSGTGGIDVKAGTLVVGGTQGSEGFSSYSGAVTLESGATINDYDSVDFYGLGTGPLVLDGGLLINSSGSTAILDNPVTVQGGATISSRSGKFKLANSLNIVASGSLDVLGTLALTGSLTGSGPLTLDAGILAVAGGNPGFSGNVTVNSGVIDVVQNNSLGTGMLTVNPNLSNPVVMVSLASIGDPVLDNPLVVESGTLILEGQFTFPNGITIDSGATLEISGMGSQVVDSGPLAGGGNVVVATGNFSDPGGSSSFTGSVNFQGGQVTPTLAVTDAGGVANGSPFPATALLSAPGVSPASSLQGVDPTLTYYVGSTATGTGSSTAPTNPGTYTVVGSFAGSTDYTAVQNNPVTFTITAPPDKLVFVCPPRTSRAGALAPLIVMIENYKGQIVRSDDSTVTLSVASGPGTLGGKVSVEAIHGVAIFSRLLLTEAGDYTLQATDGSDTSVISNGFVIKPAAPAKLVYVSQPQSTGAGDSIGLVVVDVEDQYGNLETGFNSFITLSLDPPEHCGTLRGAARVRAVNGVATFSNLSIDAAGSYQLDASLGPCISGLSSGFTIWPGPATQNRFANWPTNPRCCRWV